MLSVGAKSSANYIETRRLISDARTGWLKDLEREKRPLKRLLAKAKLEKAALKEMARGNF
jgi:hypothetical protein